MESDFKSPDVGSGDMGEAVARMLEDPETLGKIMNIAGALSASGGLGGLLANGIGEEKDTKNESVKTEQVSVGESSPPHRERVKTCDRIRLLEAMRPFLSCEKRDKLDVVIKIIGLADAAGGLYGIRK